MYNEIRMIIEKEGSGFEYNFTLRRIGEEAMAAFQ